MFTRTASLCSSSVFRRFLPVLPTTVRPIHATGFVAAKKFVDAENDFAHQVIQKGIVAPGTVRDVAASETELLDQLGRVVAECRNEGVCISEERFDDFARGLAEKVPEFGYEELVRVLNLLVEMGPTPAVDTRNYARIWNAVDAVCLRRVPEWDTDRLLFMADQWYPLRLAKVGRFVGKAVWKISGKMRKLNKDQLVKTVFYINLTRVPVENMVDIEINLKKNFYNFGIDDLSVLCMGFFKTMTPVRSVELIERIYQLTIHHAGDVQDISLAAILKLLRYSSRIAHAQSMERLLSTFVPQVPRLSLFCCLHLALLGTDIHLCHQPILEAIIDRFSQNIKQLRLKDMERIVFALAHFNMDLPSQKDLNLMRTIQSELPTRIHEITTYPKSYLSLLNFLTLKEIYSEELITAAFDRRFLQMTYGRNVAGAGREVIALDSFLRINAPTYSGNLFPEKPLKVVAKLTQDYVPSTEYRLTKSDRMLLEIQSTFTQRHRFAHIIHVLPHYQRPDVIALYNKTTGAFEDVEAHCPLQYSGAILSRECLLGERASEKATLRLVAIVAGSWNCYVRDQHRFTGGFAMKLKQLAAVGYETVVIPWHEWPTFAPESRDGYLFDKLNPLLDNPQNTV
uniref:FAST kinase domain-containing protein 5 n=1 Tax=Culex pipiens TaxID=7175 RepID=A0A8D8ARI9_CULPI